MEGTGAATITDIEIESLPNREIFEEIYPDSDLDKSDDEDSDNDDESEFEDKPELEAIKEKLVQLKDNLKRAKEVVANADNRLKILDAYGKSLDSKEKVVPIADCLEVYKQERAKAFEDHMEGLAEERKINYEVSQANKEQTRLLKLEKKEKAKVNKEKAKIQKAKAKIQLKRAKREQDRLNEKARIFKERQSFWPKYCYSVRIQLDVNIFTPMSSRRASFSSDVEMVQRSPSQTMDCEPTPTCDLVLSYITSSAFWSPSYDLQLSTTNNTGSLCFDARLTNSTSETWENCKLTLSTSQANFTGLDDATPLLRPWRIKLASKNDDLDESNILSSREESNHRINFKGRQMARGNQKLRSEMFGLPGPNPQGTSNHALQDYQMQLMLLEQQNKTRVMMARQEQSPAMNPQQQQMQQQQLMAQRQAQQAQHQQQVAMQNTIPPMPQAPGSVFSSNPPPPPPQAGGLFGPMNASAPRGGGLFGSSAHTAPDTAQFQQQQMQQRPAAAAFGNTSATVNPADLGTAQPPFDFGDDGTLFPEPEPVLDFQESLIEETGLTTTYDLPGHKTLIPKSTASKQRIARTSFNNVYFLHTIVAKYQPAAHFKAKVKNSSKLHLLKGPVSLTLDGSFMGRTDLPRCSPGDIFSMSLGVDPAIKVIYPKPETRRSTTGMFSKEQSSTYVRSITVHNTRSTSAGKPVNLLVLDQIPVSEDERLRVELSKPQGLALDGPGATCGVPGRESKECLDWGKATGFLKKAGQVSWEVKLNAGKAVKLALEYSVSIPNGEFAKQCN